ncbi:retrovirus-related Pol polyprotein from transposon opus [Trichonephila clavipes]|nr:retrovirus-related Pol polyprotein from transposon opus [Trichonephila clavipes]
MGEENLLDHVISQLEPQLLDYVEVLHPQTTFSLLQIIDKKIGGKLELTPDTLTIADRRGNPTDLEVKVLLIIGGLIVDAEVVNLIIDSIIKAVDRLVRGTVLSGFRMVKTDQPRLTHVLYHEIDTGEQEPVVPRLYRYDRVKQVIIDYHIEKMLHEDSPEAYRFTIDYRKLNAITKYPRYPLPAIDDLFTNIPHTTMMSIPDLKSGYFQLAINPRVIEKTAFITRNGTFAFVRMQYGLSETEPNFQKSIDIILRPVLGRFVNCYMDDVIITSSSFNEHIDHLNQVKEKGGKFNWSTEVQDYFNKVKRALTEVPVLKLPNFQEQFNLFIDASGVGIGAVLNQNHRPIALASRTLKKDESNYIVTECECLAVIWTLNKFKTYFGTLPVKVITDHTTLTKLAIGKNLSSRMIRWALKLSEFNIEWELRPGVQNIVADVLFRNAVDNVDE